MKLHHVRTMLFSSLLSSLFLVYGPAWGVPAFPTPCSDLHFLEDWQMATQCSVLDKNYTFVSASGFAAPQNDVLTIASLQLPSGVIQHTVQLGFNNGIGVSAPLHALLEYTVTINDLAVNLPWINAVRFDTTTGLNGSGGATSTSDITPDVGPIIHLQSTNGSADPSGGGAHPLSLEPQSLAYANTYNVADGGSLFAAADTLIQTAVPEPSTWLLLATGALGVLAYGRRRSRAA